MPGCGGVAKVRVGLADMVDKLSLNRAAEPATGALLSNTPGCVVLRIRSSLRPLFAAGNQNPTSSVLPLASPVSLSSHSNLKF